MSLDLAAAWCSEREILAIEHNFDIFVFRRKQIINLIEDRSLVLATVCLLGNANCKIKQVIVDLGIAADEIAVFQNFSYTEDLSDLLTFT